MCVHFILNMLYCHLWFVIIVCIYIFCKQTCSILTVLKSKCYKYTVTSWWLLNMLTYKKSHNLITAAGYFSNLQVMWDCSNCFGTCSIAWKLWGYISSFTSSLLWFNPYLTLEYQYTRYHVWRYFITFFIHKFW